MPLVLSQSMTVVAQDKSRLALMHPELPCSTNPNTAQPFVAISAVYKYLKIKTFPRTPETSEILKLNQAYVCLEVPLI